MFYNVEKLKIILFYKCDDIQAIKFNWLIAVILNLVIIIKLICIYLSNFQSEHVNQVPLNSVIWIEQKQPICACVTYKNILNYTKRDSFSLCGISIFKGNIICQKHSILWKILNKNDILLHLYKKRNFKN